ncbi:MAG: CPBP family intramembrane metalloprotease [Comamonas sp.]|jgi:membrane protease YdiL (CAAX protease family)|uniref:CPBP family intramembrane glutamic endopeptidase n=1 Tax=Comamonas sp. TaxID=34028 RepID=UPI0028268AC2|nr:CPBP family glutamic-type intramembrane protease [Comamonas sp.]MDR0216805.1 CPBP family intramembrane metalloprotease [Comamonas sp.]MDR2296788.1 CPBP family intramembrane metalloprotease [Comamonas sp.]
MRTTNDFPFYNGTPVQLSTWQWCLVLAGTALGFTALIVPIPLFEDRWGQFIPAILFATVPLAALALATPRYWKELFHRIRWREIGVMVLIALLSLAVSLAVGVLVKKLHGMEANPVFDAMTTQSAADQSLFFLRTIPQLLGEELVTMLPLLALMTLFHSRMGLSRRAAIILAWLLSAMLFGALHLPTYGWNLVQCLVVIGSARLVLSLAYLWTKNLWVSAGAHILNDWTLFGLSLLTAGLSA